LIHRKIDSGLESLKEELIHMAGLVEEAVEAAICAWRDRDSAKIDRVCEIEYKVNLAHKSVDSTCFKLLATQQPLAADLRLILSIIKINADLERMVDQAVNIVENARYYLKFPPLPDSTSLSEMSDAVRFMVREAIDAFVRSDALLATNVLRCDDKVDNYKDKIFRDVLDYLKTAPKDIEQGFNVILIARNLERIGDHSTNIAEDVIFTVSGEDIRHSGAKRKKGGKWQANPKS
jgi:phosphate transport system protein